MDDVGWGDFGCYGGGVAVGAPTPNIDQLARRGLLMTSCYSEPSCTPSRASLLTGRLPMRHGLHRPPMYGEPGGLQGEVTLAELLSDAGYVTQAVGKWHLGENVESQPQNVGFDDFYGFLSVSDMYSEWRDPYFFPEVVYSEARTDWIENMPFNRCFVHAERGGERRAGRGGDHPRPLPARRHVVRPTPRTSSGGWPAATDPWFCYLGTRGAHFDNYPHERFLGISPAKHPYKDTIIELDDIVGSPRRGSSRRPARPTTRSSSCHRTTARTWRTGPTPRTPRSARPRARPGRAACGCRASWCGRA